MRPLRRAHPGHLRPRDRAAQGAHGQGFAQPLRPSAAPRGARNHVGLHRREAEARTGYPRIVSGGRRQHPARGAGLDPRVVQGADGPGGPHSSPRRSGVPAPTVKHKAKHGRYCRCRFSFTLARRPQPDITLTRRCSVRSALTREKPNTTARSTTGAVSIPISSPSPTKTSFRLRTGRGSRPGCGHYFSRLTSNPRNVAELPSTHLWVDAVIIST